MFRNPVSRGVVTILALTILHLAPATSRAQSAPSTSNADYVPGEVLVAFREDAGFFRREAVLENVGGRVVASRPVLGYEKLELPAGRTVESAVEALQADPDVAWAEPNWIYRAAALPIPEDPYLVDLPASPNQWGLLRTGLATLWQGGGGDPSVVIAIVDSGVDSFASPHADLAANVLNGAGQGRDFIDGDFVPTDVGGGPGHGHGTAAAGAAAGVADTTGMVGMAYNSRLAFVRVLDCNLPGCQGTNDQIAQGIAWAADSGSADIINLSLAGPNYAQAMRNAILHAIGKDAIVIAASGNDSSLTLPYPANYPEVITVGATNSAGAVPTFSNSGPNLDVVAPGVDIWLPDIGGWAAWTGTSFAAPLVSGVAALLRARNPEITQLEVKKWLTDHAVPTSTPARDGAGEVNYQKPADWGDLLGHAAVGHGNSLWEWLGEQVTHEVSDVDPLDTDGIPNVDPFDAQAHDLGDDAVFPMNLGIPPFLPTRWAPAKTLDIPMTVSNHLGPRYGASPGKMLYLDQWIDWNDDGVFNEVGPEHTIVGHTENPATWAGAAKSVSKAIPVHDEHILGLPLEIRTRVSYGSSATSSSMAEYGEVEDLTFVNFVEDFDLAFYTTAPGPYMDMGTWFPTPDPDPLFSNHGAWHMARGMHPAPGTECNGFVEAVEIMKTPPMDWSEYTSAAVTFVYSHQSVPCGPAPFEACRVEVLHDGVPVDSTPIPIGSGTLTWGVPGATGTPKVVEVRWIVDTDNQGHMFVDDIRIVAIDDEIPAAIAGMTVGRTAGSRDITVSLTAPHENPGSPAKDGVATGYRFRYSTSPILNDFAYDEATPVLPGETTGGAIPTPGLPGTPAVFTFTAPSAFDPYYLAVKAGDEVVHMGALSNVPSVTNSPTLALAVTAPAGTTSVVAGDSVTVAIDVTNNSNVEELIRLGVDGALQGWDTWFVEGGNVRGTDISVQLGAGATTAVTVGARAPGGVANGTIEHLQLTATSTTDTTKTASGFAILQADAVTDAPGVRLPITAALEFSGPNPFRGSTSLSFAVPSPQPAQLVLFDVAGRRVRTLLDEVVPAGIHRVVWNGRNEAGREVPSGIYFLKVVTEGLSTTKRVIRMR